jgi:erythromycin esterase
MSTHEERIGEILRHAQPFDSRKDLAPLIDILKEKKVVMLGEATHGTSEFYSIRAEISLILLKEHGFRFVAVEGDWPDIWKLNRYIRSGQGVSARAVLSDIRRWPRWMWANEEVANFAEGLKSSHVGFYGLDVYSLFESMSEVILFARKHAPDLALKIEARYACFEPYEKDEIAYARSLFADPSGCTEQVVSNLRDLLRMRLEPGNDRGGELFSAQQNARIVKNAEQYYRTMIQGDTSWNVRDRHMLDVLERLLEREGDEGKAIVWAHNTHIGDYRATDMAAEGYVNIGGLARDRWSSDNVSLVGMSTHEGTVIAGMAWGAPEEVMALPPSKPDSCERAFHEASLRSGQESFYLVFDDSMKKGPLSETVGHRAVGVVYDPLRERRGNYVPSILTERYDALLFFDRTTAVHPLRGVNVHGMLPETWPSGQ